MITKTNLDMYWDEFIGTFIRALLEDGYDEFEILDKIMSTFKMVREQSQVVNLALTPVPTPVVESEPIVDTPIVKPRKYPEHKKPISREKNPYNYDKTLHSKFPHALVYVKGAEKESLATIEMGISQKSRDCYKLVSTGKEYSEVDYLKEFNHNINETPGGYSFLNRHVIVFKVNPDISVGYVKNTKHYHKFKDINDIRTCSKPMRGRKSCK